MNTETGAAAAVVVNFPTPPKRDEGLTLRRCIDAYMAAYTGRDNSRVGYLSMWVAALGDQPIASLDADIVGDALDRFAATPVQRYAGKKDGKPVLRAFGPRRLATINRSKAMLSAVLTWAQRRRLTPRGWRNPCREIPGLRENNARARFLSNAGIALWFPLRHLLSNSAWVRREARSSRMTQWQRQTRPRLFP